MWCQGTKIVQEKGWGSLKKKQCWFRQLCCELVTCTETSQHEIWFHPQGCELRRRERLCYASRLSRAHNHAFSEKNKASWRNICRPPDKLCGLSKHAPKRKAHAWLRFAEAHATKQNIVASTYDNLEGSCRIFSCVLGPYLATASSRALILVGVFNHRHIHQRRWPNQRVIAKHSWSCPTNHFHANQLMHK